MKLRISGESALGRSGLDGHNALGGADAAPWQTIKLRRRKDMTDALVATESGPARDGVAGRVFRTELNPVDFLRRAAYSYPEKIAVVDGDRRFSYRELAERSWRLANALRSAGLSKGDRVATLLFNS